MYVDSVNPINFPFLIHLDVYDSMEELLLVMELSDIKKKKKKKKCSTYGRISLKTLHLSD